MIQDVCYNHFDGNAARAEWQYDSEAPEQNIYYWYEGKASDYSSPEGGYVDNGSSGSAPRYWEEVVRHLFISSAAAYLEEFHIDGFRVDLTQAFHRDNALHADGRILSNANLFGQKLLREWSRTLRMIRPNVMLIAEDHTGWNAVTQAAGRRAVWASARRGSLPFTTTWSAARTCRAAGRGSSKLRERAATGRSTWNSSQAISTPASSTTTVSTRVPRRDRQRGGTFSAD